MSASKLQGRVALLVLSIVLTGACMIPATRTFLASRYSMQPGVGGLRKATQLEANNASHWHKLGLFLLFSGADTKAAEASLTRAVALNPHEGRAWLALANVYHIDGNVDLQRRALEQAVRAEPRTPSIAWEAANMYIAQNDANAAIPLFRVVLESGVIDQKPTLTLLWRSTRDVDLILAKAIPPKPTVLLGLVNVLIEVQEPEPAAKVWAHLLGLQVPFEPRLAFPYINSLLEKRDLQAASDVWNSLLELNEELRPYRQPDNWVTNGSFAYPILNGGFDWRYSEVSGVSASLDSTVVRFSNRSLMLSFDGTGVASAGITQWLLLQPGADYEFTAFAKTEELLSSSGPRFSLSDPYTGQLLLVTEEMLGTTSWRSITGRFRTGVDNGATLLQVVRNHPEWPVKGKLWISNVTIRRL